MLVNGVLTWASQGKYLEFFLLYENVSSSLSPCFFTSFVGCLGALYNSASAHITQKGQVQRRSPLGLAYLQVDIFPTQETNLANCR